MIWNTMRQQEREGNKKCALSGGNGVLQRKLNGKFSASSIGQIIYLIAISHEVTMHLGASVVLRCFWTQ